MKHSTAARSVDTSRSTLFSIYAALAANILITLTKFSAALYTGSSAMVSEGFHSLVDTGNEVLLLYGQYRANRPADRHHPLGHGRELYFWSFIVAVLIFSAGAGLALYEGISHILVPVEIRDPRVNYIVLAIAFVADGVSCGIAYRNFRSKNSDLSLWQAVVKSKDPAALAVLFEDGADMVGVAIAFVGIFASLAFGMPILDGAASIGISLLLVGVATLLARESKGLLIGEAADPEVIAELRRIAEKEARVRAVRKVFTIHLGPDQIVAALSLHLDGETRAPEVDEITARIDASIRTSLPAITAVFFLPPDSETADALGSPREKENQAPH